jgi:hypothetical protein
VERLIAHYREKEGLPPDAPVTFEENPMERGSWRCSSPGAANTACASWRCDPCALHVPSLHHVTDPEWAAACILSVLARRRP